jgi:hypothetical protein
MSMPRSSHRRIAVVALFALLTCAAPSLAAGGRTLGSTGGWLQGVWSLWEGLSSLWSAAGEEGDAGARIDGNGAPDQAGARIDGNGSTDRSAAQLDGDAGARIDGNGGF